MTPPVSDLKVKSPVYSQAAAGPFWMIKVNDELPEGVLNTLH